MQGKLAETEQIQRQAVELWNKVEPQGSSGTLSALNLLALALEKQHKEEEAEQRFRQAMALMDKLRLGAHPAMAGILNNLGGLMTDQCRFAEAEQLHRRALQVRQRLYPPGHPEIGGSLLALAGVIEAQNRYAEAEELYRQALALFQKLGPHALPTVATTMNSLANLQGKQGKYLEAERQHRETLALRQKLFPQGHADVTASLCNVALAVDGQGRFAEGEQLLRQALAMLQKLHPQGHPTLDAVQNNLAMALLRQEKFAEAEVICRQVLAYRRTLPLAGQRDLADSLINLSVPLHAQGKIAEAEVALREALTIWEKLGVNDPHHANCLQNMANLLSEQGKYAEAEQFLHRALRMRRTLFPQGHDSIAGSLNNLGFDLGRQNRWREAEQYFQEALNLYQRSAQEVALTKDEGDALTFLASLPNTRDGYLSVTRQQIPPPPAATVYPLIWQNKATLQRMFEQRHHLMRAAAKDPQVQPLWRELQDRRRQRERLLLVPAPANPTERDEQLSRIDSRVAQLNRELLERVAREQFVGVSLPTPSALQQALPPHTVFLDFLRYVSYRQDPQVPGKKGEQATESYLVFVVPPKLIHRVELGAAKPLEDAIMAWRAAIAKRGAAAESQARLLAQRVWEPLAKHFPPETRQVYLAPDMYLTLLPWAALPGDKPGEILLERYTFVTVPHGPFLLQQLTRKALPSTTSTLLTLGGVQYDALPATAAKPHAAPPAALTENPRTWKVLPGTTEEIDRVQRLAQASGIPVKRITQTDADSSHLQAELPQARYAHLATHGFFADEKFRARFQLDPSLFHTRGGELVGAAIRNPLVMSGLVLAGANRPETPDRGIITADSLINLPLEQLELAVLSACDTGLGAFPVRGEGVFGLQRAFHLAGCQNVIASLWKVDDWATTVLMEEFYRNLWQTKLSKREALRQAQLYIYRHPEQVDKRRQEILTALHKAGATKTELAQRGFEEEAQPLPTAPGTTRRSPAAWWAAFQLSGLGD